MSSHDSWLAPHEKPEAKVAAAIDRAGRRKAAVIASPSRTVTNACDASPRGRHEYAATGRERTGEPGEGYPVIGQFACKFCLTLEDVIVKAGRRR